MCLSLRASSSPDASVDVQYRIELKFVNAFVSVFSSGTVLLPHSVSSREETDFGYI